MQKTQKIKGMINNMMLVVILLFLANQYFVSQAVGSSSLGGSRGSKIQLRDNAGEGEIIAAILPKDSDTVRPYTWQGQQVTLSAGTPGNGYDMLVAMNKSVNLVDESQKSRFSDLSNTIYHPCCDVPIGSCGCKHAVAARGLVKYLLAEGYTDEQIKDEVFVWNRYWWPKHYATAAIYLNSQGTNPASVSVSDWLGSKLSTVRAGRKMRAALGT